MTTTSVSNIDHLVAFRKKLHAHPEVSGQEHKTAQSVAAFLKKCNPTQLLEKVGGTGVIAIYDSGRAGKTVLFRAELDALPIQEINEFEHRSQTPNVSHKCGHDGHTTILLGMASQLSKQPPTKGKLILLFQPAEENGEGAKAVLAAPQWASIQPDYVFALHNLPAYPLHQIVLRDKAYTSAVTSIIIRLHGKTAHAAEPEHGNNPAPPIADLLRQTEALSNNEPAREDFTLITPIHIHMGEIAYGISAGYGEVHLTVRTWTQAHLDQLSENILDVIQQVSKKYNIKTTTEWTHSFHANQNDSEAVHYVRQAAQQNGFSVVERTYPFKWGEDFGLFTQKYKGAMVGIGAGENCPALHNPDYDFPDALLSTGIRLFSSTFELVQNA